MHEKITYILLLLVRCPYTFDTNTFLWQRIRKHYNVFDGQCPILKQVFSISLLNMRTSNGYGKARYTTVPYCCSKIMRWFDNVVCCKLELAGLHSFLPRWHAKSAYFTYFCTGQCDSVTLASTEISKVQTIYSESINRKSLAELRFLKILKR